MRILVHDYSGHPFQMQLSRALARREHDVLHVHCSSYDTGKGAVERTDADPAGLTIEAIGGVAKFDRYSWPRRIRHELGYGKALTETAERFNPDVILSSNDPLFAKRRS